MPTRSESAGRSRERVKFRFSFFLVGTSVIGTATTLPVIYGNDIKTSDEHAASFLQHSGGGSHPPTP